MIREKSNDELRDDTFIAARETENLLLLGLPEVSLCYSDGSRKFLGGLRRQGDGKWTFRVWNREK